MKKILSILVVLTLFISGTTQIEAKSGSCTPPEQGPPGPTGPTGPGGGEPGPTGPTGPTGASAPRSFASLYHQWDERIIVNVLAGDPVPFEAEEVHVGTDISYVGPPPNVTQFTLVTTGYYLVTYGISAFQNANDVLILATLNGTPIENSRQDIKPQRTLHTISFIFKVTSSNSILKIINDSTVDTQLQSDVDTAVDAFIVIQKL